MYTIHPRSFVRSWWVGRWKRKIGVRIGWLVLCCSLCASVHVHAQNPNEQLWLDLEIGRVRSEWTLSTEISRRELLTGDEPKWVNWNFSPAVERSMTPHWDLILGVPLSYTEQTDAIRTGEVDIQVGSRFLFTPFKSVQTNLLLRYEQRYMTADEPERTWEQSSRTRLRAEVKVPLDTRNYYADTLWYAMADAEVFIVMDQDLNERFANRTRVRTGIGRKFNYNWRVEFIYTFQRSRQALTDDARTSDNIFRFRLKYYFDRKTDKEREPSGSGY